MKKFTDEFTNQFENRELQPDEYLNESDHLIYCTMPYSKAGQIHAAGQGIHASHPL